MRSTYRFGAVYVTMISGFDWPPEDLDLINLSERRNAGSIVIRLQFAGRSNLFAGDAVGQHIGDPPDSLIASKDFMVENTHVME